MLPYYVLEKTDECKLFFRSHKGFFNFWNQYLILNAGYTDVFLVMVNRPKRKFCGDMTREQEGHFKTIMREHLEAHLPEEMFRDFPELEFMSFISNTLKKDCEEEYK